MRLNRHDYDFLYRVYVQHEADERVAFPGQVDKLVAMGCVDNVRGMVRLLPHGKRQLQRVRGVGEGTFRVPTGHALVPRKITPTMLGVVQVRCPQFTAADYALLLSVAPRVKG